MDLQEAKDLVIEAFQTELSISSAAAEALLPSSLTAGKIYEAFVLAETCRHLSVFESCTLKLVNGTKLVLKTSHGPINKKYPWIEVSKDGNVIGELFTDIEFLSLSYSHLPIGPPTLGDYHELDIALVAQGASGRPRHDQLLLAIECKNTVYNKGLLKEILGVRREMSLLADLTTTGFDLWPATKVPADPPSCLVVYSTSGEISKYAAPGKVFGIDFFHLPMA